MEDQVNTAQTNEFYYLCPCCKKMLKITSAGIVKKVELDTAPTVIDPISGVAYSLVVDKLESLASPMYPGWPLAKRKPHECEWPLFAGLPVGVHDKVSDKKNHQSDQCITVAKIDHSNK